MLRLRLPITLHIARTARETLFTDREVHPGGEHVWPSVQPSDQGTPVPRPRLVFTGLKVLRCSVPTWSRANCPLLQGQVKVKRRSLTVTTRSCGHPLGCVTPQRHGGPAKTETQGSGLAAQAGAVAFECQLDAQPWAPCASPATYTSLEDGPHAFHVRAVGADAAGARWQSPASEVPCPSPPRPPSRMPPLTRPYRLDVSTGSKYAHRLHKFTRSQTPFHTPTRPALIGLTVCVVCADSCTPGRWTRCRPPPPSTVGPRPCLRPHPPPSPSRRRTRTARSCASWMTAATRNATLR